MYKNIRFYCAAFLVLFASLFWTQQVADVLTNSTELNVQAAGEGWLDGWQYRKSITIDQTQVSEDLTDFPVLVSFIDADVQAAALASGADIVFTAEDGATILDYEIDIYHEPSGVLLAWIKVPLLESSADTVLYMYYGNASATDQQNVAGVWSNGYEAVYHLTQSPHDSSANGYDGTVVGTDYSTFAFPLGTGASYDAEADSVDLSNWDVVGDQMTLQGWFNLNSMPSSAAIVSQAEIMTNDQEVTTVLATGTNVGSRLAFGVKTGASAGDITNYIVGNTGVSTSTWYYVTGVYDGSQIRLYVNGQSDATPVAVSGNIYNSPTWDWSIGNMPILYQSGALGTVDEVRVSSAARSAGWIETEFNNQSDPDTFYTVGTEEEEVEVVLSVELQTDGTVAYGILPAGDSEDTVSLGDSQVVRNNGNVPIDILISSSAAAGGTPWSLAGTPGTDEYVHEFSANTGSSWTPFAVADEYQTLASDVAVDADQGLDLQITVPTENSDFEEKNITVTVQAVLPE